MLLFVVVVATLVATASSATVSVSTLATLPAGCTYNGKWYPAGKEFKPSACEFCQCDHGQAMCAIADCFFTPCVDAVHDPDKCCPQCPNGNNCYGPNKQIIPAGKEVTVRPGVHCSCPDGFGFLGNQQARCRIEILTTPPRAVD